MAENKTQLERNSFVKGFVTEASPLTFPENASIDEENFVLNTDGYRRRRLGFGLEDSFVAPPQVAYIDGYKSSIFTWNNMGNDANRSITVCQIGPTLILFGGNIDPISSDPLSTTSLASIISGNNYIDSASINGELLLVSEGKIIKIFYQEVSGVFAAGFVTETLGDLQIRDLEGVDDGYDYAINPVNLTPEHAYNLLNQGWTKTTIDAFFVDRAFYPSNADIAALGYKADGVFDASIIVNDVRGNAPAPRGKYTLPAFGTDKTTLRNAILVDEGYPSLVLTGQDLDNGKIDTVAPYGNRIFYSGAVSTLSSNQLTDFSPNNTGTIFFTPLLKKDTQLTVCHQLADPTSIDASDLVATDGGTIRIAEAGKITSMIQLRQSLLVMSENGVWEINGPDDVFRADEFWVKKLTSFGPTSRKSVVLADDKIFFWTKQGIVTIYFDSNTRSLAVGNITEQSIQKYYDNDISAYALSNSISGYDPVSKTVRWFYSERGDTDETKFERELVFDLRLQAFSKYKMDLTGTNIVVVDYVPTDLDSRLDKVKYFCLEETTGFRDIKFCEYNQVDFKDFGLHDAKAFMVTGWESFNETQRVKQLPYLTTHFQKGSVDSSCLISTKWDFTDNTLSGKWTKPFQAYRLIKRFNVPTDRTELHSGYSVITTKNRVRGSGRVFSFLMETEEDKECIILGWAMKAVGTTNV